MSLWKVQDITSQGVKGEKGAGATLAAVSLMQYQGLK